MNGYTLLDGDMNLIWGAIDRAPDAQAHIADDFVVPCHIWGWPFDGKQGVVVVASELSSEQYRLLRERGMDNPYGVTFFLLYERHVQRAI